MKTTSSTAIFFGSGPVAADSLRRLLKHTSIEAVVTKPSTCADMEAIVGEIHTYTVSNRQELDDLLIQKQFKSSYGIVIDFGIIISQAAIESFPLGIVNSHFSLLPEWRGADPISFAILSGQNTTGVSLMLLAAGLDEGDVLAQSKCEIEPDDTTPTLTDKLIQLSDALLADVLPQYIMGDIRPVTQKQAAIALDRPYEPTYSRKLTKDDGYIDWSKSALQLEREIRAFAGWPRSRTKLAGKDVIIVQAHIGSDRAHSKPGDIDIESQKDKIAVQTASGTLVIDRLQPSGKAEMTTQSFLNGYRAKLLAHPYAGEN